MPEEIQSEESQNPSEAGNSVNENSDQFNKINQTIQQLGQNQVALQQMLAQQMQNPQPAVTEAPQESNVPTLSDDDLESLSRKDLVALIENRLVNAVTENLKPVTEKISNVEQNVNASSLQRQVSEAKGKYKDFDNYAQDMLSLHKQPQYKLLDVDSLYQIAKAKDPSKAYKEPEPEPQVVNKKPEFGGFFPSSAAARDPERNKSMSRKEAVESAWNEIFGGN